MPIVFFICMSDVFVHITKLELANYNCVQCSIEVTGNQPLLSSDKIPM
jgi:hypothetical protein